MSDLTRPIIGIENRTAQEVFDIMCDRFRRAPSPSPAPVVEALTAAKDFIALEYADPRQEQYGEWLAPEARKVFGLICEALASLSQPAKEREGDE